MVLLRGDYKICTIEELVLEDIYGGSQRIALAVLQLVSSCKALLRGIEFHYMELLEVLHLQIYRLHVAVGGLGIEELISLFYSVVIIQGTFYTGNGI